LTPTLQKIRLLKFSPLKIGEFGTGSNLTARHAQLGRFINRDPIGELGGLNLYAYVLNELLKAA